MILPKGTLDKDQLGGLTEKQVELEHISTLTTAYQQQYESVKDKTRDVKLLREKEQNHLEGASYLKMYQQGPF